MIPSAAPTVTAFASAPEGAKGLVRDLRVRWAFEEVGRPYRVRRVPFEEMKGPAYRALHPFGQVPAYEEDGLVLFESGAIVLHIADRDPGLLPPDGRARARSVGWLFAALDTVEPPIWDRVFARFLERDEPWSALRLPSIERRIRARLRELSDRLRDDHWLDGEFSAGDLMMVSVLRHPAGRDIAAEFPNLAAYIARGEARPAFGRALAAHLADFDQPAGEDP